MPPEGGPSRRERKKQHARKIHAWPHCIDGDVAEERQAGGRVGEEGHGGCVPAILAGADLTHVRHVRPGVHGNDLNRAASLPI